MSVVDANLRGPGEAVLHIDDGVGNVGKCREGGKTTRCSHEQVGNLQECELMRKPKTPSARNEHIATAKETVLPFLKAADHHE